MARRHAVAAVIKDAAGQQGFRVHPCGFVIAHLLVQLGLRGVEQLAVENGRLLARENLAFEDDFSHVKPIAQKMRQRSAREWDAANSCACPEYTQLSRDP